MTSSKLWKTPLPVDNAWWIERHKMEGLFYAVILDIIQGKALNYRFSYPIFSGWHAAALTPSEISCSLELNNKSQMELAAEQALGDTPHASRALQTETREWASHQIHQADCQIEQKQLQWPIEKKHKEQMVNALCSSREQLISKYSGLTGQKMSWRQLQAATDSNSIWETETEKITQMPCSPELLWEAMFQHGLYRRCILMICIFCASMPEFHLVFIFQSANWPVLSGARFLNRVILVSHPMSRSPLIGSSETHSCKLARMSIAHFPSFFSFHARSQRISLVSYTLL